MSHDETLFSTAPPFPFREGGEYEEKDLSASLTLRWSRKRRRWECDNTYFWHEPQNKWCCRSEDGRYADMPLLCQKYELFPKPEEWAGKILLLESSEEKMSPSKYRKAIEALKEAGIFHVISGILMGKPMDETYTQEYKQILTDVINNPRLPILCNVNIGHAQPRCIIPFGVPATVDANSQVIRFGT